MTRTEWNKKKRALLAGQDVKWSEVRNERAEHYCIVVFADRYGYPSYSLCSLDSGNTIEFTWDLGRIASLVID